ncbi:META domain-containing protein [Neotamlana laminarinivorans]|uniref:META domain-containing protein n=1 Tax=Neotamlana laminarinivorans TaxID=2883124 RepID=A0A9X1I0A4_9FLAO|nr:META domain-containing protein [Tamlana laminarinivorans]MCB4799075.1 META domain-containing protein [Tamlana laminarinivorans]
MKSLIMLVCAILIKCGSTKTEYQLMQNNPEIHTNLSGDYTITMLSGNDVTPYKLNINFDKETNKVAGFSGCNRFFGSYILNDLALKFNNLASTRKMCAPEQNAIESKLLNILNKATSVKYNANGFSLYNNNQVVLKAEQEALKIEYIATSRGIYKEISVNRNKIETYAKSGGTPIIKPCETSNWNTILKHIKNLDVSTISELKAPSHKYAFDGAALAHLKITKNGKTYKSAPFDHGNPPAEISNLVKEILSLSENIE